MTENESDEIISEVSREGEKPYLWGKLTETDQDNIRRFLRQRCDGSTDGDGLYHDLSVLVSLASNGTDGSLSSTRLSEFKEPTDRPGRVLAHFLVFVGAESPACPKCGHRNYEPADDRPGKMRCQECTFIFTIEELAYLAYSYRGENSFADDFK